jgi:hypothetical protein
MDESKGPGMQGLSGANSKTIVNELFIFGKNSTFHDFVTAIGIIVKKGMAYVLHMNPDLVGPACFKFTLY